MQDDEVMRYLASSQFFGLLWWQIRKPGAVWALGFEISSLASTWLEEDRAFRATWPWETDVLIRMAIDSKARIAEASPCHA